jgi:ribosome-binding factor A
VTITDVKVTGDLQHASIFYTVYGTDDERRDTGAALKSATGMLRSEVGKNITARLTPSLEFILDALPENAASIDRLLQEARQRDHESQTMASSAEYAGDADPYVKPRDLDDDDLDDEGRVGQLEDDLTLDDELGAPAASADDTTEPDGSTR